MEQKIPCLMLNAKTLNLTSAVDASYAEHPDGKSHRGGVIGTGSFKRAKHIKVCYFWLKDLLDYESIELIYTPKDELVADILTKPLQG
jgi:hypothetical protein